VYIAHNKFMTLLVLKGAGFPVPNTYLAVSRAQLEDLLDEMRYPVVMKLLYGSLGKGVMFADSKGSAVSMMDTLERFKVPIFLEQYIPNPGEDIRVFVLGARVIGAMKRRAQRDERRANIAIGGRGVAIRLKPEVEFLAIDAAKTLGMDVCGIDVILGPKGPQIIEANVNVHFEELARVTGVNVPRQIVEWIKEEIDLQGQPAIVRFVKKLKRYGFPHLSQLR
jgi:ribosomal protein S6--L-glutamate ligase